jgi:hypothetical protein
MRVEIGTEYGDLDASVSRTGRRNEAVDFRELEGRDRRRRVEVEENGGKGLWLLRDGHSLSNFLRSCGIRRAGNRGNSLRELKRIQGLVERLGEVRNGDLRLSINTRDKVRGRGKGIKRRFWRREGA